MLKLPLQLPMFVLLMVCVTVAGELPLAKPEDVGLSSAGLAKVDAAIESLLAEKKLAGAIVMIARHGKVAHLKSQGTTDPRYELAARILANWELGQIIEQPNIADGVARLALNLADSLYKGAQDRGWVPQDD